MSGKHMECKLNKITLNLAKFQPFRIIAIR